MMDFLRNTIAVFTTFIIFEILFYWILDSLFGKINFLKKTIFNRITLKEVFFYGLGLIILFSFFELHLPS